jgi:hypothetical protein
MANLRPPVARNGVATLVASKLRNSAPIEVKRRPPNCALTSIFRDYQLSMLRAALHADRVGLCPARASHGFGLSPGRSSVGSAQTKAPHEPPLRTKNEGIYLAVRQFALVFIWLE